MNTTHDKTWFGGIRESVIERDNGRCIFCGITRTEHFKKYGRDITVDHIDGKGRNTEDKNNLLSNLQTLCLGCHGRKDSRKLTDSQAVNIFHVRDVRGAGAALARAYGVNPAAVRDIKNGKSWSHLTGVKRKATA